MNRCDLVGFAVLGIVGAGCSGNEAVVPNGDADYPLSVARLHSASQGLLAYQQDHDDFAPVAGTWIEALSPYVQDQEAFHSPAVPEYGYALNASVAGQNSTAFEDPSTVLSLFDSTILIRSATAGTDTLPSPPRYAEGNTMAFLDGHVAHEVPILFTGLQESRQRMGSLGVAALMYAGDNDDVLPTANWVNGMWPYVRSDRSFRSPFFDPPSLNYGYAMNQDLVGLSFGKIEAPAITQMFFDSTVLTRGAVAAPSTKPSPGRYEGVNTWVHANGSVGQGP